MQNIFNAHTTQMHTTFFIRKPERKGELDMRIILKLILKKLNIIVLIELSENGFQWCTFSFHKKQGIS
jgi:hypothetical protein